MHLLQTFGEPQSLPPSPWERTKPLTGRTRSSIGNYTKKRMGTVLLTFACVAILAHDMRPCKLPWLLRANPYAPSHSLSVADKRLLHRNDHVRDVSSGTSGICAMMSHANQPRSPNRNRLWALRTSRRQESILPAEMDPSIWAGSRMQLLHLGWGHLARAIEAAQRRSFSPRPLPRHKSLHLQAIPNHVCCTAS